MDKMLLGVKYSYCTYFFVYCIPCPAPAMAIAAQFAIKGRSKKKKSILKTGPETVD